MAKTKQHLSENLHMQFCSLRMSENNVRRRIFGPTKEKETGGKKNMIVKAYTVLLTCVPQGCKSTSNILRNFIIRIIHINIKQRGGDW
jgi:hypothetical protein